MEPKYSEYEFGGIVAALLAMQETAFSIVDINDNLYDVKLFPVDDGAWLQLSYADSDDDEVRNVNVTRQTLKDCRIADDRVVLSVEIDNDDDWEGSRGDIVEIELGFLSLVKPTGFPGQYEKK